jgi:hypothetical protein
MSINICGIFHYRQKQGKDLAKRVNIPSEISRILLLRLTDGKPVVSAMPVDADLSLAGHAIAVLQPAAIIFRKIAGLKQVISRSQTFATDS